MSAIGSYLLSVLSVAVLCSILNRFFDNKDGYCAVIQLLAGIFLTVTVIRPLVSVAPANFLWDINAYNQEAAEIVEDGQKQAYAAIETFIKEQTQEYILNETKKLKLDVMVEVKLDGNAPPLPKEVTVTGAVSPYAKSYLTDFLINDIGIPKENQLWIG